MVDTLLIGHKRDGAVKFTALNIVKDPQCVGPSNISLGNSDGYVIFRTDGHRHDFHWNRKDGQAAEIIGNVHDAATWRH